MNTKLKIHLMRTNTVKMMANVQDTELNVSVANVCQMLYLNTQWVKFGKK